MARPNKIAVLLLKMVVSGGLLYLVISKAGLDKVIGTLQGINKLSFILAVGTYIFTIFVSTIRWRLLLHENYGLKRLFSLYLVGSFFNHLLPGLVGGDAVKAYYLYKETGKSAPAVASVFMDRYIGFTGLMCIGLAAFPFGLNYFRGSYIEWILPLIVLVFVLASILFFKLRLGSRLRFLSEFYEYFALYKGKRAVIIKTFLISVAVQTIIILVVYALSLGLNVAVPLLPLFIFIPIISAISTLPVSISGIGVREASFVLLFGNLGISPVHATAISFAWFLSVATGSLLGLIEYIRLSFFPRPSSVQS